jgi:hypothetical protein
VTSGEFADRSHGSEIAVHRIKTFEQHDLGTALTCGCQWLLEMTEVVVPKDLLRTIGLVDAFDHRVVIQFIGENQAAAFWLMPR